ncbi:MAG: M23 family metallopeptidase [Rickettsiales bacterium]|jgi:murein DD-endopeptidase MepM/ murein hydrolase activator NlpD|nr:M23 family metallopeptidase [Rickettsiales bacterium]
MVGMRFVISSMTLLLVAACTQPAARVDVRGSESFAKDSTARSGDNRDNRSYSIYQAPKRNDGYKPYEPPPVYTNTKPVSQHTQQAASLQSISSSDLPPPAESKPARVSPWKSDDKKTADDDQGAAAPQPVKTRLSEEKRPAEDKYVKLIKPSRETGFMWPVSSHKVISSFGPKGSGKSNDGVNIASPEGELVWAASGGEVVYVDNELKGYGNMVIIKHPGGKSTSYAHLSKSTVSKYDRVKRGDIIGYVGSTGNVKKSQLFFAVREGNDPVDPKKHVSMSMAGL